MKTQKTWRGKSAYGWLVDADVVTPKAGLVEIMHPELPYHVLYLFLDRGELVFSTTFGDVVALRMTPWAAKRAEFLLDKRDVVLAS